ncbi:helix-turn-helix transcriptional regulator [Thauera butanivorans]|uniref:helix-turn-helix transcriptional regulator n=1 Tax=Thauera butanivorans TaxID=86174 RepID=UPI003AB325CA
MPESLDKTIPPGCGTARRQKQAPRERFIRVGEVSAMIGLGKTTIYKYVSERRFPTPVALGGNRVAWLESEVLNWMCERVGARKA